ncbi:MAG: hypothetical protein WC705_02395 [Candidatus Paceibacterota bacterium]|jgi:cell division protein FtsB
MKEDKMLQALELIKNGVTAVGLLIESFLEAGYGASLSDMDRAYYKTLSKKAEAEAVKGEKQKFYNLVYRLKRDGLIESKNRDKLRLTNKGKILLGKLRIKLKISLPVTKYKKGPPNNRVTVVAFDVPEAERKKRKWLSVVLKNLDFNLIQKSVWIGKTKLPEEFLDDLRGLKMLSYVEIFEITKHGSLEQIS